MKCRKGLEAYNQFQSGWVQKVLVLNTTEETCVLIAKVLHSQRLSESPLRPWVASKKDGTVICAHCNCMAGYGDDLLITLKTSDVCAISLYRSRGKCNPNYDLLIAAESIYKMEDMTDKDKNTNSWDYFQCFATHRFLIFCNICARWS